MSLFDAPEPREPGQDFLFIAQVSDVFSASAKTLTDNNEKVSLITTAGKHGLVFISNLEIINVYRTADLIDGNNSVPLTTINGKGTITHLSTSCDCQTLFVCGIVNEIPFSFFYDIFNLISNISQQHVPYYTTPLCTLPGSRLASLAWNPCDPCCIAIAISNGDLSILRINEKSMEFSSSKGIRANVVTWSAKGKQLSVGKQDGTVSLFKPDLTHVRDIERPPSQEIGSVININWFTNTEFFVGYLSNNNTSPVLFYVNAPKGKVASFYNFEDVCYSNEREKPVSYYSYFISEWNLLFVLSSNGVEMGIVGKSESSGPNDCQWCQWFPDDGARASMNFVNVVQETFPLGLAFDFTSNSTFLSKDEQVKGPLPLLLSLSTGGELNAFFVENKLTETPNICISAENIPSINFRTPEQYGQINDVLPVDRKPTTVLQLNRNAPSAFSSVPKVDVGNIQSKGFSFSTPIKPSVSPVTPSALFASTTAPSSLFASSTASSSVFASTTASSSAFASSTAPSSAFASSTAPFSAFTSSTMLSSAFASSTAPFSAFTSSTTLSSAFASSTAPSTAFASSVVSPAENVNSKTTLFTSPFVPKPVSLSSEVGVSSNLGKMLHIPSPKKSLVAAFGSISSAATSSDAQFGQPSSAQNARETLPVSSGVVTDVVQNSLVPVSSVPKASKHQLMQLIKEEMDHFERELLDNSKKNNVLQCKVGDKEDDRKTNTALLEIEKWMTEMTKTTQELNEEVCQLHKNTFEALAAYEDADSHYNTKSKSRSQMYMQLRPLDPYSQRRISEIRSKYYYLASQITEVVAKLDLQWEEYNASKKSNFSRRVEQSTTENLYRSVLNLHNSRVSYEKQLDEICHQLKRMYSNQLELTFLTSNMSLSKNSSRDVSAYLSSNVSNSTEKLSKLSPKKISHLQEILSKRVVTPIRQHVVTHSLRRPAIDKNLETVSTPGIKPERKEPIVPQSAPFLNMYANDPPPCLKYEDISPPVSPEKSSLKSFNPLAALSSLVGKVSQPSDQKSPNFSFSEANAVVMGTTSAQEQRLIKDENKSIYGISTQDGLNKNFNRLSDLSTFSNALSSSAFSFTSDQNPMMAKAPVSNFSPVVNMSKNQSAGTNNSQSLNLFSNSAQKRGDPSVSSAVSSLDVKSGTQKSNDMSAVFKNIPASFSNSQNNDGLKAPPSSGCSDAPVSNIENKTMFGDITVVDKVSTDNSSLASSKTPLFSFSKNNGNFPFAVQDSSAIVQPKLNQDFSNTSSSTTFGESSITDTSPLLTQLIFAGSSSAFGNQTSKPSTADSLSKLLQQTNATSSDGTALTSTTTSVSTPFGLSTTASASSPLEIAPITNLSSLFAQQSSTTLTGLFSKPLTTALTTGTQETNVTSSTLGPSTLPTSVSIFGQAPTTPATSVGPFEQRPSSIFNQSNSSSVSSLFSKPIQSPAANSAEVISSSAPLLNQTAVSSTPLFKQSSSLFGQVPAASQPSIFGGVNSNVTASQGEKSVVDQSSAGTLFAPTALGTTITPLATPQITSEQPAIPNFSSLMKPTTTTSSLFSQIGSSTSIFGLPPTTSKATILGQDSPLFTPAISSAQPTVASSTIFNSVPTTSSSIFGNLNQDKGTAGSVFGIQSTSPSIFGNKPIASNAPLSIFGQSQPSTVATASVFGTPSTSGSMFGAKVESGSSIFGNVAQNPSTITSTVPATQPSLFSSGFGQQSSNTSILGGGSIFSGLGSAPSEEKASKNVFGNLATGATTGSQPSLFGGGGAAASSFGSLAGASNTAAAVGAFSPVKTGGSIFGGAATFGGSAAFGSDLSNPRTMFGGAPAFGSPPAFGAATAGSQSTFGGAASPGSSIFGGNTTAFGSGSTFGGGTSNPISGSTVFGGGSAFGAGSPGGGFSSFANAESTTFGSLAGSQSSSNANGSSFGGSSFSGWRS